MRVTLKHVGSIFVDMTFAELLAEGRSANEIAEAFKAQALRQLTEAMNTHRDKVASACAGKLIAYQFKAKIAAAPADATSDDLILIDREAAARGVTRQDLLGLINAKHSSYREVTLLIEALEAEGKAAINALPNETPDFDVAVGAVLDAEVERINTEIAPALAAL